MAVEDEGKEELDQFEDEVSEQSGLPKRQKKEKKPLPSYKMLGDKYLVTKAFGMNVEKKKRSAMAAYQLVRHAWDEAYRYYNHDQAREDDQYGNNPRGNSWWRRGDSYENLVFSNASVMIPSIYAKNPDVHFNTDQDEDKDFTKVLSKAINSLFVRKEPYGVNLKPRMKKAALHCELTNMGIVKLDWIDKDKSSQGAQAEMSRLVAKLEKAKNPKQVEEIEGEMIALETEMEWREPAGFKVSNVSPLNLLIDPFAENEDGSDANWMLERTFLPTNYLNAKFTEKKGNERRLLYKPTHKLKAEAGEGAREDALGMVLQAIDEGVANDEDHTRDEEQKKYVYENMTQCWWYWDKPSRRLYLFADNDWTWPLWCWEDPLRTTKFFPYYLFQFYPSTGGICAPGEVSYYLDQQDEINEINAEVRKIRRIAFKVLLFNSNKIKTEDAQTLAAYLRDGTGHNNAIGVDLDPGMSIRDAMETLTPPSFNFEPLFNKQPIYAAVDKIGSVSDAIRGAQFKTNTTEDAVQAYTSAAQLRLSNRTDAIEECIASLAWSMAEILVDRADMEYIRGLVGDNYIDKWKPMSIMDLNAELSVQVAAGSSEKPTSNFKKEEAIKVAQSVGQFAKAAPGATLKVVLKLLANAFPELSITEEDFESISGEVEAQLSRGSSAPGQPGGNQQAVPGGAAPGEAAPIPGGQPGGQLEQVLMQLPPEAQQMVVEAVQQGATPQEALQMIMEQLNGAGPAIP